MNPKNTYKFYIGFLIVLTLVLAILFGGKINKRTIASPLPSFLTSFLNDQVSTLNLWMPFFGLSSPLVNAEKPIISAKSALVYDLEEQKILFSKNPRTRLPMASLTKIMTAVIAIENPRKDDEYVVFKENLIGENSMGLSAGERLSLQELLYGLILSSGNDAAEALSSNFEGGRNKFVKAMNDKAKALGLRNTNFTNPSGLEGDGKQYTTAYDLLVITKYALQHHLFKKIVSAANYHIPYTLAHKEYYLENGTNLLTSYPGVFGVKDGYTPEAGLCLVTYLRYQGHEIIGILLGSDNRRQEMKDLLDYGLIIQGIPPPPHG